MSLANRIDRFFSFIRTIKYVADYVLRKSSGIYEFNRQSVVLCLSCYPACFTFRRMKSRFSCVEPEANCQTFFQRLINREHKQL